MANRAAQKRFRDAKALSRWELKLKQREGSVEQREAAAANEKRELQAYERFLEERQHRVNEQSRVAEAMARLGFDPGPMPGRVAERAASALFRSFVPHRSP
jgi:hypothetical protein